MDVIRWVLVCFWSSFVTILKTVDCYIDCGSCKCDKATEQLISCADHEQSTLLLKDAKITEVANDFEVSFNLKDSYEITVVFGENLMMNSLGNFAEFLKAQNVTVTRLEVLESADLSLAEFSLFYREFQKDIKVLQIKAKLRPSEDKEAPYQLELSQDSKKELERLTIYAFNEIKGDLVFKTGSKSKVVELHSRAHSDASFKDFDIYFDESMRPETEKEGGVRVFIWAFCTNEDPSPTYPRLIQVNSTYWENKNTMYYVELDHLQCREVFLPTSFLAHMNANLELVFDSEIPTEIEWGALGTEKLKMKEIMFVKAEQRRIVITSDIEELWSKYECARMPSVEMCVICLMQHFGLHRIQDDLAKKCSLVVLTNTHNTTNPQALADLMQLKVKNCLRQCPKDLNYPDGVAKLDYRGYVLCGSGKSLTKSCNFENRNVVPTTEIFRQPTTSTVGPEQDEIASRDKTLVDCLKIVAVIGLTLVLVVAFKPIIPVCGHWNPKQKIEEVEGDETTISTVYEELP